MRFQRQQQASKPGAPLVVVLLTALTLAGGFALGLTWGQRRAALLGSRGTDAAAGGPQRVLNAQARGALEDSQEGAQQSRGYAGRIPKVLHRIFIVEGAQRSKLTVWPHHQRWVASCQRHHSATAGWEYRFWDAAACEALVADYFPQFLSFYQRNLTLPVERSDMIRYMILYKFGGLYLDSDVDCWRESGDMLEGYDVVLQGTHEGESTGNAVMASAPGIPAWLTALEMVKERNFNHIQGFGKVLARTGPQLVRDVLLQAGLELGPDGLFKEEYQQGGLAYKIYPAGRWFLPCQWYDEACRRRTYLELAEGHVDLGRVVGMHRFAGSWIKGKEDGRGIHRVEEEICKGGDSGPQR